MELLIGSGVSILVQWIKQHYGNNQWHTLLILLGLSLVAAAMYQALVITGYWHAVEMVLISAGAFYAFVLQRFENSSTDNA